jgi:hypothetical protein
VPRTAESAARAERKEKVGTFGVASVRLRLGLAKSQQVRRPVRKATPKNKTVERWNGISDNQQPTTNNGFINYLYYLQ